MENEETEISRATDVRCEICLSDDCKNLSCWKEEILSADPGLRAETTVINEDTGDKCRALVSMDASVVQAIEYALTWQPPEELSLAAMWALRLTTQSVRVLPLDKNGVPHTWDWDPEHAYKNWQYELIVHSSRLWVHVRYQSMKACFSAALTLENGRLVEADGA